MALLLLLCCCLEWVDSVFAFSLMGPADSGEGSGVEVGVQGLVEVQQEVKEGPLNCGGDLERDDGVQVDTEEVGRVEEEVEMHSEEEVEVHSEEEVELHSQKEVELHREEEVEMHSEEEVEVDSEEEVEVDTEEDEAHVSIEENLEEVGNLDNSDSEYRMEDSDNETEGHVRGLSDDEWESDVLLTPDNSASEEDETEDRPSRAFLEVLATFITAISPQWQIGVIPTPLETTPCEDCENPLVVAFEQEEQLCDEVIPNLKPVLLSFRTTVPRMSNNPNLCF
ncbi:hypothetical protein LR48_Vigan10g243800 [Vigna angularis]|uniref:Uncharacterized protein n=1 Tax=Phaseolus angularis TaxID=3914 RepID=A0A0L9VNB3_PHAAN|nr:hypothetical protein LR48_Vigan10g243800 [Vigna angularis]